MLEVANVKLTMPSVAVKFKSAERENVPTKTLPENSDGSSNAGFLRRSERYAVCVSVRGSDDPGDECCYREP